ncbi:MAG: P1 family peptidase, partial [Hoeflea sp.]
QDGLARAVRPVHAPVDGDTIFVLATGTVPLGAEARYRAVTGIGALAADCVARAIARGVYEAETLGSAISWRERHGGGIRVLVSREWLLPASLRDCPGRFPPLGPLAFGPPRLYEWPAFDGGGEFRPMPQGLPRCARARSSAG